MSQNTGIEWTDATWNPVRGCSRVSEGCRNCYAERQAHRFSGPGRPYEGLTVLRGGHPGWTGKVTFAENHLLDPLKWGLFNEQVLAAPDLVELIDRPRMRRIFVNSMSDLFHENVPDEWIDKIFGVMALCPQHTFQILTKRPARMFEYLASRSAQLTREAMIGYQALQIQMKRTKEPTLEWPGLPLPNVWLGVSCENQAAADERIPYLIDTPAAVKFISAEPLLGEIRFSQVPGFNRIGLNLSNWWVIVGGESGPGARPMNPAWPRKLLDQCLVARVPFFFKQWGEWREVTDEVWNHRPWKQPAHLFQIANRVTAKMMKVGKKTAGSKIDGREWKEFPEVNNGVA